WTSRRAVSPSRPDWPLATAPSAPGRRLRLSSPRPGTGGAGCTRPRTCRINGPGSS
ncbi:MAG: hypothetical protein AVDCRST_MAG21-133, partial [uncultured Nocardioidaceae bacterium]